MAKINENYLGYMARALLEIGEPRDALFFCAPRIKADPMNPTLLYYQAKGFMDLKLYDYALIIAKYACELAPESNSTWVLLTKAYITTKSYKYVIG